MHVGSDKTGSTSIQFTMHKNRAILAENGYLYAEGVHHPYFAAHFSKQPSQLDFFKVRGDHYDFNQVKQIAKESVGQLENQLKNNEKSFLVLSYEGFTGLSRAEMQEMRDFLSFYAEKIEVIYYLRSPFSYAASAMSERVRFGTQSWNIDPPVTYYEPRLRLLADVFGKENLCVRHFKKDKLYSSDVRVDFLAQIGLSVDIINELTLEEDTKNIALSEEAILIGDEIICMLEGSGIQNYEYNEIFAPALEKIAGRRYVLDELQTKVIESATHADLSYIKSEFGLTLADKNDTHGHANIRLSKNTAISLAKLLIDTLVPGTIYKNVNACSYRKEFIIKRAPGQIKVTEKTPSKISSGQSIAITVTVSNHSQYWWGGKVAPVKASYHWSTKRGHQVQVEQKRTLLQVEGIEPGQVAKMDMLVQAPEQPGEYYLTLTLLQEFFKWFENIGFCSEKFLIEVK